MLGSNDDLETPLVTSVSAQPTEETPTRNENNNNNKKLWKVGLILIFFLFITLLIVDSLTTKHVYNLIKNLNEFILDQKQLGFFYLFLLLFVFTIIGIPCTLFIIGGSFAFCEEFGSIGILFNIVVGWFGCFFGAITSFSISRYLLRECIRSYIERNDIRIARAIDIAMKKEGIKIALMLRMVPYIPWNFYNYISGVTSMKFRSFLIGGIAMLPWMTICSLIGSTLNSINEASSNNSNLLTAYIAFFGTFMTVCSSVLMTKFSRDALKEIQREESDSRPSESSILFPGLHPGLQDVVG